MPRSRHDVLVIGGGPAGATAATLLARRGMDVLLVESRRPGRAKACGGCLDARAVRHLRSAQLDAIVSSDDRATSPPIVACEIHAATRATLTLEATKPAGRIVDRARFDEALRRAAVQTGATLIRPARVKPRPASSQDVAAGWIGRDLETHVEFEVQASLVVVADGLGSGVARELGWAPTPARRASIGFAFNSRPNGSALKPDGVIRMFVGEGGYVGTVVRPDGRVHVGGMIRGGGGTPVPAEFCRRLRDAIPAARLWLPVDPAEEIAGGFDGAAPMPWHVDRIASARAVLLGDAAGYAEPFTGEGIGWAIESARLLDRALGEAGRGRWNDYAAASYTRLHRRAIGRRRRRCSVVGAVLARPRLAALAAATLRACPPWRRSLARTFLEG